MLSSCTTTTKQDETNETMNTTTNAATPLKEILNCSGYFFINLEDPKSLLSDLKAQILAYHEELRMKGEQDDDDDDVVLKGNTTDIVHEEGGHQDKENRKGIVRDGIDNGKKDGMHGNGNAKDSNMLTGTVLLSPEGINLRLSGRTKDVLAMQTFLSNLMASVPSTRKEPLPANVDNNNDEAAPTIEFRNSYSSMVTLKKFLVKIKSKEIISMGISDIEPARTGRAPAVSPTEFNTWLNEDKDMLVLDTRNDYEVRVGTFNRAKSLDLKSFRAFPSEAERQLSTIPKKKPVVMFCTGGVRCEKAAFCLIRQGFEQVYQLEGGILAYFEQVGKSNHYNGNCYVFDQRIALRPTLESASNCAMCYQCRAPLTSEDEINSSTKRNCVYCINGKNDFRSTEFC